MFDQILISYSLCSPSTLIRDKTKFYAEYNKIHMNQIILLSLLFSPQLCTNCFSSYNFSIVLKAPLTLSDVCSSLWFSGLSQIPTQLTSFFSLVQLFFSSHPVVVLNPPLALPDFGSIIWFPQSHSGVSLNPSLASPVICCLNWFSELSYSLFKSFTFEK